MKKIKYYGVMKCPCVDCEKNCNILMEFCRKFYDYFFEKYGIEKDKENKVTRAFIKYIKYTKVLIITLLRVKLHSRCT